MHGFFVALISIDRQPLQLFLILCVVKHRLRQHHVHLHCGVETAQRGPMPHSLHLHCIQHQRTFGLPAHVANVTNSHLFEGAVLPVLQVSQAVLRVHSALAYFLPQVGHVVFGLLAALPPEFLEVHVLSLRFGVPEVLSVLSSQHAHVFLELLAFVFKLIVDFSGSFYPEEAVWLANELVRLEGSGEHHL